MKRSRKIGEREAKLTGGIQTLNEY